MNIKKWEILSLDKDNAAELAQRHSIPFFLAMLLDIRGFQTDAKVQEMLYTDTGLSDPFLMKDMDKAVARIRKAIDNFEKIAVYGDYDADGVTATAILFSYLETVGADVIYYIPNREGEGYGMNSAAVEALHAQGIQLIITVDNGISSLKEVALANELGMDVVVTDHHRPHEKLPDAVAVVDPHRKDCASSFKEFCGAGVVLKLLIALEDGDEDMILSEYADLAALGTIGDVMPVIGENRTIIKLGLEAIAAGGKPGIEALLQSSSYTDKNITAKSLAFTVIPRINATGRMGAPDRAVRLLSSGIDEEAEMLAAEISGENEQRKKIEAQIVIEATEKIEANPAMLYDRVLVLDGAGWHHGVIGIVAARITDTYGKPCMIISRGEVFSKGSGRSVEGFSLFDAVMHCAELFDKFGGHPMAAGITLKTGNIEAFRIKINEYAKAICNEMPAQTIQLDCKLNPKALHVQMPLDMLALEPFGSGNAQPVFGLYGVTIENIVPVGGGGHLRLNCSRDGTAFTCMRFGVGAQEFQYPVGAKVDMAVSLDAREYKNLMQLTISVKEIKLSAFDADQSIHAYRVYEKVRRKEELKEEEAFRVTPDREDLAAVYRYIVSHKNGTIGIQTVLAALPGDGMNLGKLLVSFDVLTERGLADCVIHGEMVKFTLHETGGNKIDIFQSAVFEQIKNLITA